jgi:hypothetical protein
MFLIGPLMTPEVKGGVFYSEDHLQKSLCLYAEAKTYAYPPDGVWVHRQNWVTTNMEYGRETNRGRV